MQYGSVFSFPKMLQKKLVACILNRFLTVFSRKCIVLASHMCIYLGINGPISEGIIPLFTIHNEI